MVDLTLSLFYRLAAGWMAPFVEALTTGKALARRCTACERTSFPPLRTCPCGTSDGEWHGLSGEATILYRTTGTDGDFALVRFDAADTNCTLRLADVPPGVMRGALLAPDGDLPALILGPRRSK